MKREIITTARAPRLSGSQAVKIGNLVFTSGYTGLDQDHKIVSPDVATQIRKTFEPLKTSREAAGSGFNNVVEVTIFLRELSDREKYLNPIWNELFPVDAPARTTVQAVMRSEMAVEIKMVAFVP